MILRKTHNQFSAAFLEEHRAFILYDIFHQVQALLLYPPNCSCSGSCLCDQRREQIVLSLNVALYNRTQEERDDPKFLRLIACLLDIPEDPYFKKHHGDAYPLWLIKEEFQRKESALKSTEQVIITLLRVAKSYEAVIGESRGSTTEALDVLVGKNPLKTKVKSLKKGEYICGEKTYRKHLNIYKSVSHFIAALGIMKEDISFFSDASFESVENFLKVAHAVRKQLISLRTDGIKENALFLEEDLVQLPSWIKSDDIDLELGPLQEQIDNLKNRALLIDPKTRQSITLADYERGIRFPVL